jgi:hypothetical protein
MKVVMLSPEDAFVVRNVLSAEECAAYIEYAERAGFQRAGLTGAVFAGKRERVVLTSEELAARLWNKIREETPPPSRVLDAGNASLSGPAARDVRSGLYAPTHVSDFCRFSKYSPGDEFRSHTDTCFARDEGEVGLCTVLLYMNAGGGADFDGGETVLYPSSNTCNGSAGAENDAKTSHALTVTPEPGLALVFFHMVRHAGLRVRSGHKYVVRTELMYRRVGDVVAPKII